MPDFQNLPQAVDEGKGFSPIEEKDLAFEGEKLTDEQALKLVIQDTEVAEKFVSSKTLPAQWTAADDLYRAYVQAENWPNSKLPKSALPMPVVMEAIETLLPQAHMAFFSAPQPFSLEPKGKTSPEAATAMSHLVMWAMEQAGFQEEIRKLIKSGLMYGTLIAKEGWDSTVHSDKTYTPGADGMSITKRERTVSHPTFDYVSLRNSLVASDTTCQDVQTARYVIHQKFIDSYELDEFGKNGDYKNVPTRAQLKQALSDSEFTKDSLAASKYQRFREQQAETPTNQASADPLKRKLELLEYWTEDRVITVLQRTIVIRNEENPFGRLPFRSCCFIDVLDSFYGFGVAQLLAGEQGLQQGVLNRWVDGLSLSLNPMWHRKKGMGTKSQNIMASLGSVINDDGEMEPLQVQDISDAAMKAIEASRERASRRVGANSGSNLTTGQTRTAEGVQAVTGDVQVKLQYFIETFAQLVFIPAIQSFIQQTKDNLEPEEMKAILSDRDEKALAQIDVMDIYHGKYSVDVLSTVKLSGRRAMASMITPISQLIGQPSFMQQLQQQGKNFDMAAFFSEVGKVTGWPIDEMVTDMTPEDMQRMQQNNPALVKAQSDQAAAATAHGNALDIIEKKGDAQAGVSIVKSMLKPHEEAATAHALALATPGEEGTAK